MGKPLDLTGERFGRLVVLNREGSNKWNKVTWLCHCDCGRYKVIVGTSLQSGNTKSCGCLHDEQIRELFTTHGERHSREYSAWCSMKGRCKNPNNKDYKHYGARGIKICNEWFNDFSVFLRNMGRCPEGLTLERIDNNGNYEPGNCKWATPREQALNRRDNILLTYSGKTQSAIEWAEDLGVKYSTFLAYVTHLKHSMQEAVKHYKNALD